MATGTTTLNFGTLAAPTQNPSVAVTGQTSILSGSLVEAWLFPVATSDHSADEHLVENVTIRASAPTAGVGFTIYGFPTRGSLRGAFTVAWAWS